MVRKGSSVRVRQRALEKWLQTGICGVARSSTGSAKGREWQRHDGVERSTEGAEPVIRYYVRTGRRSGVSMPLWLALLGFLVVGAAIAAVATVVAAIVAAIVLALLLVFLGAVLVGEVRRYLMQFYWQEEGDMLARRRTRHAVPEVYDPERRSWRPYPALDTLHRAEPISEGEAKRRAGLTRADLFEPGEDLDTAPRVDSV
jgi:hypothetical protein